MNITAKEAYQYTQKSKKKRLKKEKQYIMNLIFEDTENGHSQISFAIPMIINDADIVNWLNQLGYQVTVNNKGVFYVEWDNIGEV